MGLRPIQRDENHMRRHPRERGGPLLVSKTMDSRLRGNDVIFERSWGYEGSRQLQVLATAEILRFAQNDRV
jgi:hypothetical protein